MEDVKEVVRKARKFMKATGDHKSWATEKEMLALLAAGAQVIRTFQQNEESYVTEATYEGIHFINTSRYPLIPTNSTFH